MENQTEQKAEVLETINRQISLAEEQRRKRRFAYNLALLCGGSVQALGSDEFVADLSAFLIERLGEREQISQIIAALDQGARHPEKAVRERTLALLTLAVPDALQEQDRGQVTLLVHTFGKWLVYEEEILPGLEVICRRLEELADWLLRMSLWEDAAEILAILAGIHSGRTPKGVAVRRLAGKALARLATEPVVEKLGLVYLQNGEEKELLTGILRSLGSPAQALFFQRIVHSSDQMERQALLQLLAATSADALHGLVVASRQLNPSAEILVDIIRFVSASGDQTPFSALQQYFAHGDRQVQHELIRCAVKLGGRAMQARLLTGLGMVDESLKVPIIRLLAEHGAGDESVMAALCEVVEGSKCVAPGVRERLAKAVAIALRSFPYKRSIETLGLLQREYRALADSGSLLLQIDRSVKTLAPQLRHHSKKNDETDDVVFDSDPLHKQTARSKVAKIEEKVRKLLRQGDGRGAGRFLHDEARAAGRQSDFTTAEMLRDRILEVDPMALAEVMELGKWLEEKKKVMTEPMLDEIWRGLHDQLSAAECKALHQAMHRENYGKGDIIVEAGELDESLYFLTSGEIGLNCLTGGDERFLRRMKPGDILGSSQFFAASVWTFSLRALSDVQVHLLGRPSFHQLNEKFPGIEAKLHEYCASYEKLTVEHLKSIGDERREFPRIPATRMITYSLPDPYGARDSRDFNGELIDISRNGLAFTVKISGHENARLLLGREISSTIRTGANGSVRCAGIVVGVRKRDSGRTDFSIHVKLAGRIDEPTLKRIAFAIKN